MKHDRYTEKVGVDSTAFLSFLSRCPRTSTIRSARPPRMQARGLSGGSLVVPAVWQLCKVSMGMAHVLDFIFPAFRSRLLRTDVSCQGAGKFSKSCLQPSQSEAGTISGMNVLRIINEPTAAAIVALSALLYTVVSSP